MTCGGVRCRRRDPECRSGCSSARPGSAAVGPQCGRVGPEAHVTSGLLVVPFFSLRGTAQPPLPLQEFLPAQPLSPTCSRPGPCTRSRPCSRAWRRWRSRPCPCTSSCPAQPASPALQPPWPLHSLWPLQTCFLAPLSDFSSLACTFEPATRPAVTAPMTFVNSLRFMRHSLHGQCPKRPDGPETTPPRGRVSAWLCSGLSTMLTQVAPAGFPVFRRGRPSPGGEGRRGTCSGRVGPISSNAMNRTPVAAVLALSSLALGAPVPATNALVSGPSPRKGHEWRTHSGDPGQTQHSPLTGIDPTNVGRLRIAWTHRTGDARPNGRSQIQCQPRHRRRRRQDGHDVGRHLRSLRPARLIASATRRSSQ